MSHVTKQALTAMISVLAAAFWASAAGATCYADYKAKQGNPLRLHYGVIELQEPFCKDPQKMRAEIEKRIRADHWTLLNVLGVFGPGGLENRKKSAGEFFLRY